MSNCLTNAACALYLLSGKALFHLNDLHRAQGVLLEAKRLKQGDSNITKVLHELEQRLAKDKQQESDLYDYFLSSSFICFYCFKYTRTFFAVSSTHGCMLSLLFPVYSHVYFPRCFQYTRMYAFLVSGTLAIPPLMLFQVH